MEDVNYLDLGSLVLVIVGALNWGLVGLGEFVGTNLNLVDQIFVQALGVTPLANLVYVVVGLSGLYQVYFGYRLYEQQ